MSGILTPSGQHQPDDERPEINPEQLEEFLRFQAEITAIPAVDLVANHAFGLQQLAMMHLMQVPSPDGTVTEPDLDQAGLAIDALGALVDGLGDRLGHHAEGLREAVRELRLAFVELSSR